SAGEPQTRLGSRIEPTGRRLSIGGPPVRGQGEDQDDDSEEGTMTAATGLAPRTSGYADVDGVHMYYEIYGEGSPLVLLHGGMLTIELNFATLIPTLAGSHTVIGVELQGHGRTADIDREITPAALARDVVGLLDHLGIDRAHVLGHSMGAGTALELAVSHPQR